MAATAAVVPVTSPTDEGLCALALYDYQAAADDEISFDPNDMISNIEMVSGQLDHFSCALWHRWQEPGGFLNLPRNLAAAACFHAYPMYLPVLRRRPCALSGRRGLVAGRVQGQVRALPRQLRRLEEVKSRSKSQRIFVIKETEPPPPKQNANWLYVLCIRRSVRAISARQAVGTQRGIPAQILTC